MNDLKVYHAQLAEEFRNVLDVDDAGACLQRIQLLNRVGRDWFYTHIFSAFDGVPAAPSTTAQDPLDELGCLNEIGCFQAVEGGFFAQRRAFIPAGSQAWFLDWCLRATLGSQVAKEASSHRLPLYWQRDEARYLFLRLESMGHKRSPSDPNPSQLSRSALFRELMADLLPQTDRWGIPASFFLNLWEPLLVIATTRAISGVFGDEETAENLKARYQDERNKRTEIEAMAIDGGGGYHAVESNEGLAIYSTPEREKVFPLWSEAEVAESYRARCGDDHIVKRLSYREVLSEVCAAEGHGLTLVDVYPDYGEEWYRLPIKQMIALLREHIKRSDAIVEETVVRQGGRAGTE